MAQKSLHIPKVVVVGDVTKDWLEEATPRSEQTAGGTRKNYELYPGFRWTSVWGGAALLERLVQSALATKRADGFESELVKTDLPGPNAAFLQSLAIVQPMTSEQGQPIRVQSFKGFTSKPNPAAVTAPPETLASVTCLVVDDAANGCRWDTDKFLPRVKALAAAARLIVVKLSRPLESSNLIDALPGNTPTRRVVVVVNADDLRSQGIDISRRLSWERTASDLVFASAEHSILQRLSQLGDLIVRFGSDGCIVLAHEGSKHLIFDARRSEDGYDADLSGTMPGSTSAFVAAVTAACLIDGSDAALLCKAARAGLVAARKLLKLGFIRSATGDLEYPVAIFDKPDGDDFVTVELPSEHNIPADWSILSNTLRQKADLPEKLVRDGPNAALKDVPVARFGKLLLIDRREVEGYRSIENLLREYILSMRGGRPKPLSIGVFGPPGSGKSFGVRQIAESIGGRELRPHTFNLTQLEGPRDLVGAFHVARDEALRGRLPLLVFDEFDCAYDKQPWGWIKYFLAPMQDGEFKDEGRLHPLGHAIFVFAGGTKPTYSAFSLPPGSKGDEDYKNVERMFVAAKVPDFVSRLKGYVDVQGINSEKDDDSPECTDKACITRRAILLHAFLRDQSHRTGNMYPIIHGKNRFEIDDAVLHAFLKVKEYRHGARSLEAILGMSRLMDRDYFGVASLPSDEQLALHVDKSFSRIIKSHTRDS